jgi:cytochrome c553
MVEDMRRSLGFLLVTMLFAAACTEGPTFILQNDDGDEGGGGTGAGNNEAASGAGATGEGAGTPSGGAQAKFIDEVYPAIATECGSCHAQPTAPQFLAANAEASYATIVAYTPSLIAVPDNSNLILHGVHTGPAMNAQQESLVRAWLELEAEERGLVGVESPPSGPTLAEALAMFGECMNYDDWTETGMNTIANSQTAAGSCNGCHASGEAGFWIGANDLESFEMNRLFPYVKRLVTGTVDENGAFAGLVESNRIVNKGLEAANCDPEIDNCHPVYSLPPDKVTAVETFVELTLERMDQGACGMMP